MSEFLVQLHCYDMSGGMASNLSPMLIGQRLDGIWHTAVVVYDKEFYFDGGVGIVHEAPGRTRFGEPQRIEQMGSTRKTEAEFGAWTTEQQRTRFGPNDYNLLNRNCNHFTQEAVQFLLGRDIPEDIRNMIPMVLGTPLGRMIQPMLERITSAPFNDDRPSAAAAAAAWAPAPAPNTLAEPSRGALLSIKSKLTDEENMDFLTALAMLESVGKGTFEALRLLGTIMTNVVEHPSEAKYRAISTTSHSYTTTLLPLEQNGVMDILRLGGFRLRSHPSGSGQQWFLSDVNGSENVLRGLATHIKTLAGALWTEREEAQSKVARTVEVLKFCELPPPKGFRPLPVGREHGAAFFSCCVTTGSGTHMGKCSFSANYRPIKGYYCRADNTEGETTECKVLCVRTLLENCMLWVPVADVLNKSKMSETPHVEVYWTDWGRGVVQAERGLGTHAGVMERSGSCRIPYGGQAERCDRVARVLCINKQSISELMSGFEDAEAGRDLFEAMERDAGCPLASLSDLLLWQPVVGDYSVSPAVACRRRVGGSSRQQSRLLVCHDMRFGYLPGDFSRFSFCRGSSDKPGFESKNVEVECVVDTSYTVSYWHLVDYFVYFSHHCITVPPKEWINAAHRNGVPILGLFIVEGWSSELCEMVKDSKMMSRVIEKLVLLCNAYNFDGYLINIESELRQALAPRLIAFVDMLRRTLNKTTQPGASERAVIWYDSITINGALSHQNGLTNKNKPFFDVCTAIFTNYYWGLTNLRLSNTMASNRSRDVYTGVDVFGRRMFGGGMYASNVAVEAAVCEGLSVALFAPGWTCEVKGSKSRAKFLRSDSKLWSTLEGFFSEKRLEFDAPPVWTCFRSGVGNQYSINGHSLTLRADGTEWCQVSRAHLEPSFHYANCSEDCSESGNDTLMLLRTETDQGVDGDRASALWDYGRVWMGDRSLRFSAPPKTAVTLVNWQVRLDLAPPGAPQALVDIAWLCASDAWLRGLGGKVSSWRGIRLHGITTATPEKPAAPAQLTFTEESDSVWVVAAINQWEVLRCAIPASAAWSHVTSVAVLNGSEETVFCNIGGVAIAAPCDVVDDGSALMAGTLCPLPATAFTVARTIQSSVRCVQLRLPEREQAQKQKQGGDVVFFASVAAGSATGLVCMGQHTMAPAINLLLHTVPAAVVKELFMVPISGGS